MKTQNNKNGLLFLASLVLVLIGSVYIQKKLAPDSDVKTGTLIVGTNANYPPFEYLKEGQLVGFDIDLMNKIAKHLRKKIVWKDLAFDTLILQAALGNIDAIAAAMTPTPERSQQVLFTTPHITNDALVVITRAGQATPTSLADLKGKEVIVNDGYTAESFMAKQQNVMLKRLGSVAEAFMALTAGRGDAYVSAQSSVQPFFDAYGTHQFNVLKLDQHETYAFAASKKHPELHAQIQHALDALEKDGTLEQLKKKWHLE